MMFQTKEEVEKYFSGDTLTCLICGDEKKSLGTHLFKIHKGISISDYKIMFGLPHSRGLVSSQTSKLQAENIMRRKQTEKVMEIIPKAPPKGYIKHKPTIYKELLLKKKECSVYTNSKIRERSLKKINSIDWHDVLEKMKTFKIAAYSLSKIDGMPSQYEFQKKRKMDSVFNEKYLYLLKHLHQVEKVCPICGKTFFVKESKMDRRNCSIKCMAKDFQARGISQGANRWKKTQ